MKKHWSIAVVGLLALCRATQAVESPTFVSATFQEILSRVAERDATSGAILSVNAKEDSPRHGFNLNFSIKQERREDETVILLNWNNKIDDGIHERYRLRIDDAMREELKKQKHYQTVSAERAKKWHVERAKEIEKFTDGKLKYRMRQAEVEATKGKPTKIEHPLVADASSDAIVWHYPDMKLYFLGGTLQTVSEVPGSP